MKKLQALFRGGGHSGQSAAATGIPPCAEAVAAPRGQGDVPPPAPPNTEAAAGLTPEALLAPQGKHLPPSSQQQQQPHAQQQQQQPLKPQQQPPEQQQGPELQANPSKPTAPSSFYCPVSMELMADPVMVATGHTCEWGWGAQPSQPASLPPRASPELEGVIATTFIRLPHPPRRRPHLHREVAGAGQPELPVHRHFAAAQGAHA